MLTIEIPTAPLADDVDRPGASLAALLRQVADRIESEVGLVPGRADHEHDWTPETYRQAARIDGVLIGATYSLTPDPAGPDYCRAPDCYGMRRDACEALPPGATCCVACTHRP